MVGFRRSSMATGPTAGGGAVGMGAVGGDGSGALTGAGRGKEGAGKATLEALKTMPVSGETQGWARHGNWAAASSVHKTIA